MPVSADPVVRARGVGKELAAEGRGVSAAAGGGVDVDVVVEFRAGVGWVARGYVIGPR
ncbi:hypothetical protein ACTWPB_24180 [Nocardia sp. IBHARD005]|uniref:hypothetical protein n=1 Tax=Nocardia sp. IBHARD005 TaxID=3457765 RepID=UPI00405A3E04